MAPKAFLTYVLDHRIDAVARESSPQFKKKKQPPSVWIVFTINVVELVRA